MFIFKLLSGLISVYALLCLIRIFLTWIPDLNYSKFGIFMARICDPYLSLFSRISFLHIGNIDFSPILSIGILSLASGFISKMVFYHHFGLGTILASLIDVCWVAVSSVITIYIIILIIRLVVALIHKDNSSTIWSYLDRVIYPVESRIMNTFFKKHNFSYAASIAITLGFAILIQILGGVVLGWLSNLFAGLGF